MITLALLLAIITLVVYPELAIWLNYLSYQLIVWLRAHWPPKW